MQILNYDLHSFSCSGGVPYLGKDRLVPTRQCETNTSNIMVQHPDTMIHPIFVKENSMPPLTVLHRELMLYSSDVGESSTSPLVILCRMIMIGNEDDRITLAGSLRLLRLLRLLRRNNVGCDESYCTC